MNMVTPANQAGANYVGVDQRAAPRTDIYARVPLTLPDGCPAMATMVNISADGVLIRLEHALGEGDLIHFKMPVIGKIGGTCIWSVGGRSGIQFLCGIPPSDYAPLLRALGARLT